MKQQTAVDFLYKNLIENPLSNNDVIYNIRILQQAKELEKQQIIDAYSNGDINGIMESEKKAERYYKETFKK